MKQCLPAICDEGFDNITKHILDNHMETVKYLYKEQENESEDDEIETKCKEAICLEKGKGKCGNICQYLED